MFGWELPPHYSGGLGIACNGLAKELTNCGMEVKFVLPRKVEVDADYKVIFAQKYPRIKVEQDTTLEMMQSSYVTSEVYRTGFEKFLLENGENPPLKETLFEEVMHYGKMARGVAKREDHDVIHVHEWLSFPSGIEAKKVSKKPLVVHVHATEFDRSGGKGVNQRVYEMEKAGMHEADRVVAISNRMKDIIKHHYGVDENKIAVVHNGVDMSHLSGFDEVTNKLSKLKEEGNKVVLYAGRLTIQKGVDYFLDAAAKVLEKDKKTIFLVVGSGDMQQQLIMQTAQLGISDKVIFAGWLKGAELLESYKIADVFVMPSVSEPFGLNALELMALGKPVIMSKQSGASEAVFHALKIDFWDVDELANMVLALLKYDSLHSQLADFGQEEVQGVNWYEAAKKCIGIYNQLCYQQ